jgi:hypothetical protein
MSVIHDIRSTLDAMGVEQQACVFAFLMSYPLTLGRLLERRGRRISAGVACSSALAFVVFTDPWLHAVLLVVAALGAVGLFIGAVEVADIGSRAIALRRWPRVAAVPAPELAVALPASERERLPLSGSTVPVKF